MNFFERLDNYVWLRMKIPQMGPGWDRELDETFQRVFDAAADMVKASGGADNDAPCDNVWLAHARERIIEVVDRYEQKLKKHIREHCLGLSAGINYALPWPVPDFNPGLVEDFLAEIGKTLDGDRRPDHLREHEGKEAARELWHERYQAVHLLMDELGIGEEVITKNRYEISNELLRHQLFKAAEVEACLRARRSSSTAPTTEGV